MDYSSQEGNYYCRIFAFVVWWVKPKHNFLGVPLNSVLTFFLNIKVKNNNCDQLSSGPLRSFLKATNLKQRKHPCNIYSTILLRSRLDSYPKAPLSSDSVVIRIYLLIYFSFPRVGRAQLYRLSLVDAHTVAQNQYTGKKLTIFTLFLSWHCARCKSVNSHTMSWAWRKTASHRVKSLYQ